MLSVLTDITAEGKSHDIVTKLVTRIDNTDELTLLDYAVLFE